MKIKWPFIIKLQFVILTLFLVGCTTKLDLRPTVMTGDSSQSSKDSLSYHVPEEDQGFVFNGQIFLSPLKVNYGAALTAKLKSYLESRFDQVTMSDVFPPNQHDALAVSVSFGDVLVKPGQATFSSSSAKVTLLVSIYDPQTGQITTEEVVGESRVSPGAAGAMPVPGLNDNAYSAALRGASNLAIDQAISQLFELITRKGN